MDDIMPFIRENLVIELPKKCPRCEGKIDYSNALNTEAKLFMVFCKNPRCHYCAEIQIRIYHNGYGKEVKARCL